MPETAPASPTWAAAPGPAEVESVADRLRKLEQSIASIQNTEAIEQFVAQRVMDRLQSVPGLRGAAPDGLALGSIAGVIAPALGAAVLPGDANKLWNRVPVLGELRLILRMYLDPRYRLSRVAQFGVPAVFALMVLNYLFWNAFISIPLVPLVEVVFERIGLIVLAIALYKILTREAARYAAVLDYLTRYGAR